MSTILGTSRTDPYSHDLGAAQVRQTLARRRVHALVVIGGRATLAIAHRLGGDGVDTVGIPKAIDNDLGATEVSIGLVQLPPADATGRVEDPHRREGPGCKHQRAAE